MSGSVSRRASEYNIGDKVKFVRGIMSCRNPMWTHAVVYRKTKNLVYIQTKSKKIKYANDDWLYERCA
jgi:hypothetical protein